MDSKDVFLFKFVKSDSKQALLDARTPKSVLRNRTICMFCTVMQFAADVAGMALSSLDETLIIVIVLNLTLAAASIFGFIGAVRCDRFPLFFHILLTSFIVVAALIIAFTSYAQTQNDIRILTTIPILFDICVDVVAIVTFISFKHVINNMAAAQAPPAQEQQQHYHHHHHHHHQQQQSNVDVGGVKSARNSDDVLVDEARTSSRDEESPEPNDALLCVVCLVAARNTLFDPCKHACCCESCARQLSRYVDDC
jgi:hypothetical protein